ncbi:hypothetical protein PoB_006927300 [Plakobranchus ocellatus]|uniref:Uncharacterized protein n=1 Tax=Plakobranchus ocellatus TaxID=259542 RepID=A0AAV4DER9_9GAST|nr:hypothetical protein PoB_006927300 [Plakobranchus ocellatus]
MSLESGLKVHVHRNLNLTLFPELVAVLHLRALCISSLDKEKNKEYLSPPPRLPTPLLLGPSRCDGGVGGTVASESALKSAGAFLSRVRAPPPVPGPDGGPESLRSPCCGLAIYKNA